MSRASWTSRTDPGGVKRRLKQRGSSQQREERWNIFGFFVGNLRCSVILIYILGGCCFLDEGRLFSWRIPDPKKRVRIYSTRGSALPKVKKRVRKLIMGGFLQSIKKLYFLRPKPLNHPNQTIGASKATKRHDKHIPKITLKS